MFRKPLNIPHLFFANPSIFNLGCVALSLHTAEYLRHFSGSLASMQIGGGTVVSSVLENTDSSPVWFVDVVAGKGGEREAKERLRRRNCRDHHLQ